MGVLEVGAVFDECCVASCTDECRLVPSGSGDGAISEKREYVFTDWDPSATSDLEAVRSVFDICVLEDAAKKDRRALGTGDELRLATQCTHLDLHQSIFRMRSTFLSCIKKPTPTPFRKEKCNLVFATLLFIVNSLSWSPAFSSTELQEDLQDVLEEMGYDRAIVNDCGISLEAYIEPNDASNGFLQYF